MRYRLSALVAVVLAAAVVSAQVNNGVISGTVRDKAGAMVAGAKVTARNLDTSFERTVQTNSQGYYILPALPLGPYELTITSQDFAVFKDRAQVTVGGLAVVDAVLGVASASTTVEVTSQSAAVEVNTQTQEQSQIVSEEQIAQLPSLTRNPYDFIAVSGNVSGGDRSSQSGNPQTSGGGQNSSDRGVGFNINGQRASGTEILLDGMENSNIFDTTISLLIPQDAVQEFRVVTNNFDAQYGRASGGVVNVSTKSGTNNFHGSAWEYNRLSAYTANTYDNNANGIPKGTYTRNQYGFTFGGPAIKNKLFFFGSTEWLRVRSNASLLGYVPTPQFVSATPQNVQDYFAKNGGTLPFISTSTKADLAGKYIAGGAFDTAIPNPATPIFGLVNYFVPADAGGDAPQNTYYMLVRGDYTYSDRTQFTFRYGRESLDLLPGALFNSPYAQYNVGFTLVNDTYLGSATHNFTQNLLSTTRIGFSRDVRQDQYNTVLHDTPTLFLYNGASLGGQPVTLPGFYNNFTGTGGLPYGGPQNTVQAFEDVAWSKGSHTIRFGGQYDYIQMNKSYGAYAQAVEQLGTSFSTGLDGITNGLLTNFQAAVYPQGKLPCVKDFLTQALIQTPGCTVQLPATQPSFARSYRYNDWALYAQDSWRASPRLTLNYGVRYEHYGVQHNGDPNLDSNLYFGPGSNMFEQLRTASIQLAPRSSIGGLWAPQWGTVAPRVGLAYDIFGDGTTSFRAGYGISYERNFGNVTFNMIQNPPNYATVQLHNVPVTVSNFGPLGTGTGAIALPPVSPRQVSPNIRTAQTQFWGTGIQRQLWRNSILSIDYNGAHGVHLYDIKNINPLGGAQAYLGDPLISTAACGGSCYARPNGQFTSVNNRGNLGYSHYNGVNVRFQTQSLGRTGLSILSNYTWAHSLDNLSSTFAESSSSSNGVGNLGYMNPAFPQLDYGSSDFDVRNRFVFSAVWSDPFYTSGKGWQRQTLGGWTITPLFSARSGIPFTVSDSTNSLNATTGPYGIPRYVPTGAYGEFTRGGVAIGPNNFDILDLPVANSFVGNFGISDFGPYPASMTGRNQFRGPGAWTFDISVTKSFQLTERFNLQFRADSFDLFNHHNMYVNGFVADAALFPGAPVVIQGKKGGLGAAANNGNHDERRFVQFALKLAF
jgi:outer membrane receptor protein involved in Fe transport